MARANTAAIWLPGFAAILLTFKLPICAILPVSGGQTTSS
jgi:hypothetical protein